MLPNTNANKLDLYKSLVNAIYPDFRFTYKTCLKTFRLGRLDRKVEFDHFVSDIGARQIFKGLYESEDMPILSKSFDDGLVYFQSPSSYFSVYVLDPVENERIMDLCASPGSKTTQIVNSTNGKCDLYACENNTSRFFLLKRNLEKYTKMDVESMSNSNLIYKITLLKQNATSLGFQIGMTSTFDKVLADVPCSNSGQITDLLQSNLATWHPKSHKKLPQLQKKLLASAFNLLKPGGTLCYSTCSLFVEENEEVIDWALKKLEGLELVNFSIPENVPAVSGFISWETKKYAADIKKCVRIVPNDLFGGFFIALIRKV